MRRMKLLLARLTLVAAALSAAGAHAALFSDDEARSAILELRQRMEILRADNERMTRSNKDAVADETAAMGRSLLELQRQIEILKGTVADLRGSNEELARQLSDLQRRQKDDAQNVMDRLSKLEPLKVSVDGTEFTASPDEKRDFDLALETFRKGDFPSAQKFFVAFVGRYPASPYVSSALFWLGNAQYALRDYTNAISNFRTLLAKDPQHMRAPEAMLSVANCQLELKDTKSARKTLADLIKTYPDAEAAKAASERLAALK
jgi:tol-pal system protein YbgF